MGKKKRTLICGNCESELKYEMMDWTFVVYSCKCAEIEIKDREEIKRELAEKLIDLLD